jgi:hypothetical protein
VSWAGVRPFYFVLLPCISKRPSSRAPARLCSPPHASRVTKVCIEIPGGQLISCQGLSWVEAATPEGKKELVGFTDGMRESAQSWRDLLLDLKRRGLSAAPELAVADGALGFWKALGEVRPTTREQRCWVHKTANVLNRLPKSLHSKAKRALQDIWMAETKKDAVMALDAFAES